MVHGKDMCFFLHPYFPTPCMGSKLLIFGVMRELVRGGEEEGGFSGWCIYGNGRVCFAQDIFFSYAPLSAISYVLFLRPS